MHARRLGAGERTVPVRTWLVHEPLNFEPLTSTSAWASIYGTVLYNSATMKAANVLVLLFSVCAIVSGKPPTRSGLLYYHDVRKPSPGGYRVTYDDRSFIIDGLRTLLLSGAVHYPRVAAGEWSTTFKVRSVVECCFNRRAPPTDDKFLDPLRTAWEQSTPPPPETVGIYPLG